MSISSVMVVGFYGRHITGGLRASDSVAPVFTSGPTAGAVGATYAQVLGVATDDSEPITMYAVAVADGAAAPSAAQVVAGTNASDVATANARSAGVVSGAALSLTIAGLSASTAYDIYVVGRDNNTNTSAPVKLDVTTTAPSTGGTEVVNAAVSSIVRSIVKGV